MKSTTKRVNEETSTEGVVCVCVREREGEKEREQFVDHGKFKKDWRRKHWKVKQGVHLNWSFLITSDEAMRGEWSM
jgi:hypothetical protein